VKTFMNTKIALSGLSIMAAMALMAGATFAFFSDSGTSTANTFSTGTLDLKLTDADQTTQDSVTASFGGSLVPGSCTGNQTLSLRNSGTVAANHAEVKVANVVTDNVPTATPNMAAWLMIDTLQYDAGNVVAQIPDVNGNGWKDLADWASTTTVLDDLALADLNVDHPLVMNVCLHSTTPNEVQSDSVVSTFTIDLNQNASQ
jgi:spore coat-associated protein N